jgi:hypothetical protein
VSVSYTDGQNLSRGESGETSHMEIVERFGEGYYLVDVPKEIRQKYVLPTEQQIKTPSAS